MAAPPLRVAPAASLTHRAEVRREELEAELSAQRAESVDFATEVRAQALRVGYAARADRLDLAVHCAGAIVDAADRHLRQRGVA